MKNVFWWPVVFSWLASLVSQTKLTKRMMDNTVSLSILDPYAGAWVALNSAMVYLYDNGIELGASGWSGLSVWVVITIWEMVMQAHFLPKIFQWVEGEQVQDELLISADQF